LALGHGVGIEIVPLWRVTLRKDRSLAVERLLDDPCTWPDPELAATSPA